MSKQILKLSGDYEQMLFAYKIPEIFSKPDNDYKQTIEKDLERTTFLSRSYNFETFTTTWLSRNTHPAYSQGNICGRFFAGAKMTLLQSYFQEKGNDVIEMMYGKLGLQNVGIAFINKKGVSCALSLAYHQSAPEFFSITYIENTTAAPKEREVLCFQSTDKVYFPSLEELITSNMKENKLQNAKQCLVEKSSIRNTLLNIDALPDEILFMIMDSVTEDGTLNFYKTKALTTGGHTNSTALFKTDLAINALEYNKNLCHYFLNRLNEIKQTDNGQPIKKIRRDIKKILSRIEITTNNNAINFKADEQSHINQAEHVQKLIIKLLSNNPTFHKIRPEQLKNIIASVTKDACKIKALQTMAETYHALCLSFSRQLHEQDLPENRRKRRNITAILFQIQNIQAKLAIKPCNINKLEQELKSINQEIQRYLSDDELNLFYHSLLNKLHSNYGHYAALSKTNFDERHAAAMSITACLITIGVGVIAAVGTGICSLALGLCLVVPFAIGSLALLGLMSHKEYQYQYRQQLLSETTVEIIQKAQTEKTVMLNTLDFYIENHKRISPKLMFTQQETKFYKQATEHCKQEESEANEGPLL